MIIRPVKRILSVYHNIYHHNQQLSRIRHCGKLNFSTKIVPAKFEEKNVPQSLLEKLKNDCITNSRINAGVVNEFLLKNDLNELTKDDKIFLLSLCDVQGMPDRKPEERMEIFKKIWSKLDPKHSSDFDFIKIYLGVHRANASISDLNVDMSKLKPTCELFQALIAVYCEAGDVDKCKDFISDMKKHGIAITENVFSSLIIGYSRIGNLREIENTIDTMVMAGLQPGTETHTKLFRAMIELGETKKAKIILKEHGSTYSTFQVLYLLRVAARSNNGRQFLTELIQLLPDSVTNDTKINPSLQNLMIELTHEGKIDETIELIERLPLPQFQRVQDVDEYAAFLIHEFLKSNVPIDQVINLCRLLIESGKNVRAFYVACEISLRREDTEIAVVLLHELAKKEKLRAHYFWPVMISSFRRSNETGILDTIKVMKSLDVNIDFETTMSLIFPKLSLNLSNPERMVTILQQNGMSNAEIFTPLITYLITQGRLSESTQIIKSHPTAMDYNQFLPSLLHLTIKSRKPSTIVKFLGLLSQKIRKDRDDDFIGRFLCEAVQSRKISATSFHELINEVKREKLKVSSYAVHVINQEVKRYPDQAMIQQISETLKELIDNRLKVENVNLSTVSDGEIPHPREMNFEQLQCHLVELETKNLNPRGVLRRLLQLAVREGKLDLAVLYKKRCDELKVNLSPGMLASIFVMNIRLKDVEAAREQLQELRKNFPGFGLDDHKVIDFATVLVEKGDLDGAREVLASQTQVRGGPMIQKNVWTLLTEVAKLRLNKTESFLQFLAKKGYCNPNNNTLLGPVVRESLLNNDMIAAIEHFKNFTAKYRKTPLQLELMTMLLHISNGTAEQDYGVTKEDAKTHLEFVLNASSQIHGVPNAHLVFLTALAEAGTENQLRKFLINPESKINTEYLTKQCEYLSETNKIKSLIKLAKCSRGLSVIRENEIYKIVLQHLDKGNRCEDALGFFDDLIDDSEFKMTQEFSRTLINLLERNNYEVPSRVLLHSK